MNPDRRFIIVVVLGIGLVASCSLMLALSSPALALEPNPQLFAPDQPLVWNQAAPLPQPLGTSLVQCPDNSDSYYLVGGITTSGVTVDTLYHYTVTNSTWITLTAMPQPRRGVVATCYQGKIYAAGGVDIDIEDSFYIYDIAGDSWSTGPSLPDIVVGAALGAWDGKLYLVGGNRFGFPWTPVDRVDVYDIASKVWTLGGGMPMPTAASFFGAAQHGPYLFAVGGYSGNFDNNIDATQRYDMSSDTWESGHAFTSQRALTPLSMTSMRMYAQGGDLNGGGTFDPTDLVEYLELSAWPGGTWTDLGDPLPQINAYPAGACSEALTGGEIWAVGGGLDGNTLYDTNLYRPAEPCLGYNYAFTLTAATTAISGDPGTSVAYTLIITNTGDTPDAYTPMVTSTWTTTVSGLGGAIDPGHSRAFTVTVEVPAGAAFGDSDMATITLVSQGDPAVSAQVSLTTTAAPVYSLLLSPDSVARSDYPGMLVNYTLQLTNTGNWTDTFSLIAGEAGWTTTLPVTETILAAGEGTEVVVEVAIPADAEDGDLDIVFITATSQGDPLVSASSTLTTTAVWHHNYLPVISKE